MTHLMVKLPGNPSLQQDNARSHTAAVLRDSQDSRYSPPCQLGLVIDYLIGSIPPRKESRFMIHGKNFYKNTREV